MRTCDNEFDASGFPSYTQKYPLHPYIIHPPPIKGNLLFY